MRESQHRAIVSHCWTKAGAGREAVMQTEPTLNSEPSPAIAGLGHVLPKKTRSPRYHKTKNPTPALVGQCTLKQVLVKKPRSPRYNKDLQLTALVSHCWAQECAGREAEKEVGKGSNQRTNLLPRKQNGGHRGTGLCLAATKGRVHKYSSNAVYPSYTRTPWSLRAWDKWATTVKRAARLWPN
jgi:hypothetical protein